MAYKSKTSKADRTDESLDFPAVILIDNCSACNLSCSMCDHENISHFRKIQIMNFDLYRKIIDEIALENQGSRVWEIFFGEPFLCKDMPDRISYAKNKGLLDVVLNSNGVLMDSDKAKAFIDAGLDAMYVGIDAVREDSYRKIRVGGDFEAAINNVLKYRNLLKEYGRPEQKLFVQFVVSDLNEKEVEEFKKFWSAEGVNVKIRPKVSWAGLVKAENLWENVQVSRKPCYWLMRNINICADGQVCLCSVDIHCRVRCGDVNKDSIKKIWNGKLKEYRLMHREGNFEKMPDMCRNCSDWQSAYAEYVRPKKDNASQYGT